MQTQHKVQLDARDKGQAPAGQPGPYQVPPALLAAHSCICVRGSMGRWCTFKSRTNIVCQVKSWCAVQSSSKQITSAIPMVNILAVDFSCECHVQPLTILWRYFYANLMHWDTRSKCSPLSCCHVAFDAGTHAAGHSSPRGSGAVWACSRLRLPPSGLPSAPKHGGQPSGRLPYPGQQTLSI